MKRETFLAPLRSGHHDALVVGMLIQHCYDKIQCNAAEDAVMGLAEMIKVFFHGELKPHFASEESLAEVFGDRLDKKHSQRLISEHRYMITLVNDGSLEALNEFAVVLADHIRFEEEIFFPWMETNLRAEEKEAIVLYFEKIIPTFSGNERVEKPNYG